jgi:integrase
MARVRLTKRAVLTVPATGADATYWDAALPGFGVRVRVMSGGENLAKNSRAGSERRTERVRRSFVVMYRTPGGRRGAARKVTLGDCDALSLEDARREARKLLARARLGQDPAGERRATRQALTVGEVVPAFNDMVSAKKKATTAYEWARLLEVELLPTIGRLAVKDVTRADLGKLHLARRKRPILANRIIGAARAFFAWCERQGYRAEGTNPARGVELYRERQRERYLSTEEIGRLGAALLRAERDGVPPAPKYRKTPKSDKTAKHRPKSAGKPRPANPYAVAAIRFLALSGMREQEALSLHWDDVVGEGVSLRETKTGRSVRPLGAAARTLLADLPRVDGSLYVFPGSVPGEHLKEIKRVWYAVREVAELSDVRLHDLRHTAASFGASGGASLHQIAALLGHKDLKSTQRYAHLTDDARHKLADRVAGDISAALAGAKTPVTALRVGNSTTGREDA